MKELLTGPHLYLALAGLVTVFSALWAAKQTQDYQNEIKAKTEKIDTTTAKNEKLSQDLIESQEKYIVLSEQRHGELTGGDSYPRFDMFPVNRGLMFNIEGAYDMHQLKIVVKCRRTPEALRLLEEFSHPDMTPQERSVLSGQIGRASVIHFEEVELWKRGISRVLVNLPEPDENGELIVDVEVTAYNGVFNSTVYLKRWHELVQGNEILIPLQTVSKLYGPTHKHPPDYPTLSEDVDTPDWDKHFKR